MPEVFDFQVERAELQAVLTSGVFARSPIVAQLLKYICEAYFAGRSHEIKEYSIAVEAFGRASDFDLTHDSIVRVEAHRLRKRLQEYYSGEGAGHNCQIALAPGNYVPQFVHRNPPRTAPKPEPTPKTPANGQPEQVTSRRGPRRLWVYAAAAALALLLASLFYARTRHLSLFPLTVKTPMARAVGESPQEEVRILAGSSAERIVDHYGNTWSGDRYFQGGMERSVPPRPIAYTLDPGFFHHFRQGDFTYDIPLKPGSYELRLYFAETIFGENNVAGGGETARVFRILANGKELQRFMDVVKDAGGSNTADIKVYKDMQPAADGKLHLAFVTIKNDVPFVNAIEIAPSQPGAIRPIRILAREFSSMDQHNRMWSADRYFHNGILVQRHDTVAGTDEQELYQNERFGNFSYVIPVAQEDRYTVSLKFCESWLGPDRPGGAGTGYRVFDVLFNGRVLLSNFDVFREAGSLRALDKTFKGLEPNAQGKLIFNFTPIRDYAMVDAIEVLDEAWK